MILWDLMVLYIKKPIFLQAFPISFAVFRTDFRLSWGPTSGAISMTGISLKNELFEIIVRNSSVQPPWLILIIAAECKDKCGETKNPATPPKAN